MLTYTEMCKRDSHIARFRYAMLNGELGVATFGFDRHMNQAFYSSYLWKQTRDFVIARDEACDLGVPGMEIHDRVLVHHMNPIHVRDLVEFNEDRLLNPEHLVCVTTRTHNAIHFGDERQLAPPMVERQPGDTTLW